MIGLQTYRRDAQLPTRVGDPAVLSEPQVLDLIQEHLLSDGAPRPTAATWTYARWKPGTSTTAGFEVEFADGTQRFVGVKSYRGEKAKALAGRPLESVRGGVDGVLAARAVVPARGLLVWTFPADRALPGLTRIHDLRRTARMMTNFKAFGELVMRPGPSRLEVLRYKPERRAVLRLDLRLRPVGGGARTKARALVRCLTPREALAVAECRRALGGLACVPALLGFEARTGLLVEEWLDVEVPAPDDFSHAEQAGRALAVLHRAPGSAQRIDRRTSLEELEGLLTAMPELRTHLEHLRPFPSVSADSWVHGDLHPDQVVREREGGATRLLDLDRLARGCAADDLATWIADYLEAHSTVEFEEAAAELLGGYQSGGGVLPTREHLEASTSAALVRLAAAGLRRLQEDGLARAQVLLRCARRIAGSERRVS